MNDSDHPQSVHASLLKSMLPEELQNWVPEKILSIPCKLSAADKEFLLLNYGITELHWASLTRSMAEAGDLLNRGADVHKTTLRALPQTSQEILGVTPLFLAARAGHDALVELLLEHGAVDDILKAGTKGDTALHAAALSGNVGVLKLLFSALAATPQGGSGAVDVKGYNARTSLHYAAGGGHPAIVDALVQAGADTCARDEYGATPFHFAAGWGNSIPCMDLLMRLPRKQHVDEARDDKGWTALHYAAGNGQLRTVQWLLDHCASVNAIDFCHGNTPLHLAARHPDVIHVLTASGADIWLENKHGEDAIGLAHNHKDSLAVKACIRAFQMEMHREEVNPFAKHGKEGVTLLHYVSAYGTAQDMDWIVRLSAVQEEIRARTFPAALRIDVTDDAGRTAVHWAAIAGNVDALNILAEHKANLNAVDNKGRSILCLAIAIALPLPLDFIQAFLELSVVNWQIQKWTTHEEAAKWMKEYYNIHKLQGTMGYELEKPWRTWAYVVQHFITKSLWQVSETYNTHAVYLDSPPIYLALRAKREDIAVFIQEHVKASACQDTIVNRRGEKMQRTALHWATIHGELGIVTTLCTNPPFSEDLKPNMEDKYGKTPLQYAKELNQAAIEKQLMARKDVKDYHEGLYRDRQVYVDATNAVLVAAALIASVTFAGWLQPPLNYVTYYDMPLRGAPDGAYASYAAVQQYVGVRVFWGFNCLSFTFAIATVLAGLVGVVPIPNRYIARTVVHLRRTLRVASTMLALSIVFVLGAFAAAGFTVLPPVFRYQTYMLGTITMGGIPCMLLLAWFVGILCVARQHKPQHSPSMPALSPPPPPARPVLLSSPPCPWESNDALTSLYIHPKV